MRTDEPSKSYDSIDLLDPLILFWRYRRLVLLIAGVVVAAAVAFALSLAPSYTAIAQVSIGNQQQNYVDIDQVVSGVPLEDTAVSDEISILLSHETMRAVVLGLRLDRDPNYNPLLDVAAGDDTNPEIETSEIALDRTIGSLRRSLTIERQGNSFTLNIRAEAASPRKAALIANAVANAYILEQYKTMQREADRAQNWFTARLEELNEKIASSAQALESFRTQNIERFGESESSLEARLAEVSRQLAVAQAERADREARVQRLHSAGSDPQALSALPEVMRSDLVGDLKNRIVSIEAELARLRVRNGGNHPDTQSRTAELSALERSMVGEIERISEVLENELRQAISIEQQLSGKVQELELARIQQLEGGRDLQSLEATLETDREIYVAFLTRFREVSETATLFQPNTRIVSEARPPQFPSGASRRLIVVLAGLLGLFLGCLAALARDALKQSIDSGADVERLYGLPHLSSLPRQHDPNWEENILAVAGHQTYGFERGLRSLCSVIFARTGDAPGILGVASAQEDSRQSILSATLAEAFARSGRKVLLVEGDVYQPSLASMVLDEDIMAGMGMTFTDALSEQTDSDDLAALDQAISKATSPSPGGMDFMVLGDTGITTQKLLSSARFGTAFRHLRKKYDLIIVNLPPVLAVSEALEVLPQLDFGIMTIRWNATSRTELRLALKKLGPLRGKFIGCVMMDVDVEKAHEQDQIIISSTHYGKGRPETTQAASDPIH